MSVSCPTWLLLVFGLSVASSYRLNVPRLLLPFHPTIPVKFELEVGSPAGGCFHWRSNRPDVVQVAPIGSGDCSDRAEVVSTAKVAGLHSTVIFAEDINGGTTLSCGVTVDDVASIAIEHTTKILYVDAAPAPITVVAFNSDGDKFSTLGEIPFEWELSSDNGDKRPLRIVPFEQSKYKAPREIQSLESSKKKGYRILLEGLVTGSSVINAKFQDQYFAKVVPHVLDLVVVANLLLIPSHDLFVPVHSQIHFGVWIVKEQGTEDVTMPSSAYFLKLVNSAVCSLDVKTSSVTALKKGTTELVLHTENIDPKVTKNAAVRPPATKINVVDPESLQFAISGNNWLLEIGRTYKINVNLLDPHGNYMYISDNTRFDTILPLDYVDIANTSKNGTYFEVAPKKSGKIVLKSKFRAIITETGIEVLIDRKVTGEQQVEIVDPIKIVPDLVAFPYLPRTKFDYQLKAIGGSGLFSWSSADSTVGSVDEGSGILRSGDVGWTKVTATDRRNKRHSGTTQVAVLDIISLAFGKTRKEAEEGSLLQLNIQLYGKTKEGQHISLTDCRSVPFSVEVHNQAHFQHVIDAASELPKEGSGCATITLRALKSGDAKVSVRYDKYKTSVEVSAYPPLTVSTEDVHLSVGTSYGMNLSGGPRPWLLDSSQFYTEGKSDDEEVVSTSWSSNLRLACSKKEGPTNVLVRVGNRATPSNELPAESTLRVRICCVRPIRLTLSTESVNAGGNTPSCPSSAATHVFAGAPFRVSITAFGRCGRGEERLLHSVRGFVWKWSADSQKKLSLEEALDDHEDPSKAWIKATPHGEPGKVRLMVQAAKTREYTFSEPLKASLDLNLISRAVAEPSSLVLWNEPTAAGELRLLGGSGHFHIMEQRDEFETSSSGTKIKVIPRRLGKSSVRIVDICVDSTVLEVPVKITDIHALRIRAPNNVEVDNSCSVAVEVVDESGEPFSAEYVSVMNLDLAANNDNAELTRVNSLNYRLRGRSVGILTLAASARSSTGNVLRSRQHSIQVFAPIQLFPKVVTLIPESTFQLEVVGGPQPTPPISFALNDSRVAGVEPDALITSMLHTGYTLLTGTIEEGDGRSSSDSVVVRVVSLTGIRVVVSTHQTEVGAKVLARVHGMAGDETPFAFGGALYPLKVTWAVSDASVLSAESPLGVALAEPEQNRYAIWLSARSAGRAVVSVNVEMHSKAKLHFKGSSRSFTAQTEIMVDESLTLSSPVLPISTVRIAPDSEFKLRSSWPELQVSWSVPSAFSSRLSVSPSGLLRSLSQSGPAALLLKRTSPRVNTTALVPVQVTPAAAIDVTPVIALSAPSSHPLTALPVGLSLTIQVQFRDRSGVLLHSASNAVNYRPHRFDLTDITASNANRTLTVTMKAPGETVLKLWDPEDDSLSTFVRLTALDQLTPSSRRPIVVSDIICFNSPIEGEAHWSVSDDRVQLLGGSVGVASRVGETHVSVETSDGQKMHATVNVGVPGHLSFSSSHPSFVSNVDGTAFLFPLSIARLANETFEGSVIGCRPSIALPAVPTPFTCSVQFASSQPLTASHLFLARPVFDRERHVYACLVEKQVAGVVPLAVTEYKKTDLLLKSKLSVGSMAHLEADVKVPFHMAFEVVDDHLSVSNVESHSAVLGIRAPAYVLSSISAGGCGDKVTITESGSGSTHGAANKHFLIKLNRAAAFIAAREDECEVVVESALTGQRRTVPLSIKIVGHAQLYHGAGEDGFIAFLSARLQHFSWLIVPMMSVCLGAILILAAWLFAQRHRTKPGVAALNTTGLFASDAPSNNVSMQSSPGASPSSYVWRNSPPRYHSTPLESMTPNTQAAAQSSPGTRGSPQLWTSQDVRRRF